MPPGVELGEYVAEGGMICSHGALSTDGRASRFAGDCHEVTPSNDELELARKRFARPRGGFTVESPSMATVPKLQLKIASPCPASWDDMEGDDRVRFCDECELNLYNLSAMTEDAARKLVEEREGRLCVRFYQREDGTVLTSDCPVGAGRPLPGTYVGRLEGDPF